MTKIAQEMKEYFNNNKDFKKSNTRVKIFTNQKLIYLFDNCIVNHNKKTNISKYSSCGWHTVTTKDRLNAMLPNDYSIVIRKGTFYLVKNNDTKHLIKWRDGITNIEIKELFKEDAE